MKNLKRTFKRNSLGVCRYELRSATPLLWGGRPAIAFIISLYFSTATAQQTTYTIDQAIAEAVKNNAGMQAVRWEEKHQQQLKKTGFEVPKTNFSVMYGQYNGFPKDNNFTVTQAIPFTALGSQRGLNNSLARAAELRSVLTENELTYQVKQLYFQLAYAKAFNTLLLRQDSIFEGFLKAASARYRTGETNLLEKTTAETQRNDIRNKLNQSKASIDQLKLQLQVLLNTNSLPDITMNELSPLAWDEQVDSSAWSSNPMLAHAQQQMDVALKSKRVEAAKLAPEFLLGYFNQTLIGTLNAENGNVANSSTRFSGIQVGLALPIFFGAQQARVKAAGYNQSASQSSYQNQRNIIASEWQRALQEYQKNKTSLEYYQTSALVNADLILKQSSAALKQGEIGYTEYLLGVRNAVTIQESYWQTLNALNQSVIYLEFLSAKK